jgi:hypothetical protein
MRPFNVFCFLLIVMIFVTGYRFRDVFYEEETVKNTGNHQVVLDEQQNDTLTRVGMPAKKGVGDSIVSGKKISGKDTLIDMNATGFLTGNLDSFFLRLAQLGEKPLRVIYFGDSQIEGDHITYTFRQRLQEKFGGAGIGFMPAKMYFNTTHNLAVITNDFDVHSVTYSEKNGGTYGMYGKFYALKNESGKLRIVNRSGKADFRILRFISSGKSNIEIISGSKTVCSKFIDSEGIEITECTFEQTPEEVKVLFNESQDFKLHGMMLDSGTGVLVDNVSFRGNLTLMAHRFDVDLVNQMKTHLNPMLFVLHFGLNVIPDYRTDYSDYRAALERDIRFLQEQVPSASFLVVSASDMMHKKNGELVVYENIDDIIRAQQEAARNTDAAFWNMQEAMGGGGAIQYWVEKGWARTDYAHLTLEGGNYVGQLLYEDIINAYRQFIKTDSLMQKQKSESSEHLTMEEK